MRYLRIGAITLLCCISLTQAEQSRKCWIYFRDKGEIGQSVLAKGMTKQQQAAAAGLSERAMARRAKVMPSSLVISAEDLPVAPSSLRQLTDRGIAIENTSRWFNAASAYLTESQQKEIASLPFVQTVEPVRTFMRPALPASSPSPEKTGEVQGSTLHSYGYSLTQEAQIHVPEVHNVRISGRGVLVGMLDSGFRWRINESTQNMHVIGEYDFIQKDSVTANETGKTPVDRDDQDSHGTLTLSVVGGYKEGTLVSPAFGADFILAKTEYVPTETRIEEDNWVAGIEWEESHGVDVVSSSLGYNEFDTGTDYTYADMNGRTATTSKAAAMAARRGVVVVSAMGNEGNNTWHFLTAPADADSILSVGAVYSNGNYASFSSVGPTSDGRTKPDVVAQGVSTYGASTSLTGYSYAQGTSLSTPLVAGVAALVLSAHPELTPVQVRDALRNTANNAGNPNYTVGWGVINAYQAMLYHGMALSSDPEIQVISDSQRAVNVFAISKSVIAKDLVKLYYCTNADTGSYLPVLMTLTSIVDSSTNSGKYTAILPANVVQPSTHFYVSAVDATNKQRTVPYNAPVNSFVFNATTDIIKPPTAPLQFELRQNYPNPFNPGTTITYTLAAPSHVRLEVFNTLGQRVAVLVDEFQAAIPQFAFFNGAGHPSGVYFYRLTTGTSAAVRSMMLIK